MMTRTLNPRRRTAALTLGLSLCLGVTAVSSITQSAVAQDRGPVQRVLKGRVEDKSGTPIKGAVVYLRDARSSSVKSAITLEDGTYRFVQLSQGIDYEVWAQSEDKNSKHKSISSFDSKNELNLTLTIG